MFNEVDSQSLINIWPTIKNFPYTSHNIRIDLNKYPVCLKDGNVHDILSYLQLVATHRVTIDNAIKSFMVYSDVRFFISKILWEIESSFLSPIIFQNPLEDPVQLIQNNNNHPYLIIISSQICDKFKYYVDIEKRLVSVSFH